MNYIVILFLLGQGISLVMKGELGVGIATIVIVTLTAVGCMMIRAGYFDRIILRD